MEAMREEEIESMHGVRIDDNDVKLEASWFGRERGTCFAERRNVVLKEQPWRLAFVDGFGGQEGRRARTRR